MHTLQRHYSLYICKAIVEERDFSVVHGYDA